MVKGDKTMTTFKDNQDEIKKWIDEVKAKQIEAEITKQDIMNKLNEVLEKINK